MSKTKKEWTFEDIRSGDMIVQSSPRSSWRKVWFVLWRSSLTLGDQQFHVRILFVDHDQHSTSSSVLSSLWYAYSVLPEPEMMDDDGTCGRMFVFRT
jgi:hypothetical protein